MTIRSTIDIIDDIYIYYIIHIWFVISRPLVFNPIFVILTDAHFF